MVKARTSAPSCHGSPAGAELLKNDKNVEVPLRSYDVFLNHRGPDVKKGLMSHLYAALKQVNFTAFVDNEEIHPGDLAWESIKSAIENSRIHIAVFSPGYTESMWCLDELHLLLDCRYRESSVLFLPIFYNVQPCDLRLDPPSRVSCYRPGLELLASRYEAPLIEKWKKALYEASMVNGFVFPDEFDGVEARLVERIVGKVIDVLSKQSLLPGPKHPVGLDEKLRVSLNIMERGKWKRGVKKLGIHGMGGLGKSTLAKSIYNRTHRGYDSACFMHRVSEGSKGIGKGLRGLQKEMLQQLLNIKDISVPNTELGKQMIRDRLSGRKVLIILDDVTEKEQLDHLMPPDDCNLGKDSQIVITTRDKRVLTLAEASTCISMEALSGPDARRLFNLHASNNSGNHLEKFKKLAEQLADACQGLPLALEVLGSHLRGEDFSVWQATAKAMASGSKLIDPQRKVTTILNISFNALGSAEEKEMFLDIACFLKGEQKDKGLRIWGSEYDVANAELNLTNLTSKCLVHLGKDGELLMHDLLCAMGREIVDKQHTDYWKRTHLWREDDARCILERTKGSSHVRGISSSTPRTWETLSLARMEELKLLVLSNVALTGVFSKIPKKIRWFQLRNFPREASLPFNEIGFHNIAILDLEGSKLSGFDIDDCMLKSLKELNLKNCLNLKELPAKFSEESNHLETLILSGCESLERVPDWVWKQSLRLRYLDINSCRNVRSLSADIANLQALTCLILNDCSELTTLPDSLGKLTALEYIGLDKVPLTTLPCSFGSLSSLKSLRLYHSSQLRELPSTLKNLRSMTSLEIISCSLLSTIPCEITNLRALTHLRLSGCKHVCQLPEAIGRLWQLKELYLNDMLKLSSLPSSIISLCSLECLNLQGCCNLCEVSCLPRSLTSLDVTGCTSLKCLNMSGCRKLRTVPHGIESLRSLTVLLMHDCDGLTGFSDVIGQLTALKEIGFDHVPVSNFPQSFQNLSNLISLRFCGLGNIQTLPSTIDHLIELTSLEIISCPRISEIPKAVAKLKNLVSFKLSECESLFQLPQIIGKANRLEKFYVSGSSGTDFDAQRHCYVPKPFIQDVGLPAIGYSTLLSLKEVTLKHILMSNLPEDFGKLPNLEILTLEGCPNLRHVPCLPTSLVSLNMGGCSSLESISGLSSLTKLGKLELCNCTQLSELTGLECLSLLSVLDITECMCLRDLPSSSLEKCTFLKALYMAGSGVAVLQDKKQPWIQGMVHLEAVSLGGNKVPDYFNSKGDPAVRGRRVRQSVLEEAWSMEIDVPKRSDACRGVLCCFVSKERFYGADSNVRQALTWVRAEIHPLVGEEHSRTYSQVLFYNRIANWTDQLHICIFRESHPFVSRLKGGCKLSVIAQSVYEVWTIEISEGYVKLIYEEDEMEEVLRKLTLRQN